MFTIVEFYAHKMVEYVPSSWMVGFEETYWPQMKYQSLRKAISTMRDPDESWPTHKVRILGQACECYSFRYSILKSMHFIFIKKISSQNYLFIV